MKACIFTVGGVCPGQNNIIQNITKFSNKKGVTVVGAKYGFECMKHGLVDIDHLSSLYIHNEGGSIIGTSSHIPDIPLLVDFLETENIDIAYISGDRTGNGTNWEIHRECSKRNNGIISIAFPQSLENDFKNIDQCIGFDTAIEKLEEIIKTMYHDVSSIKNGVFFLRVTGSSMVDDIYERSPYIHMIVTRDKPFNYCEFEMKMKTNGFICIAIEESCENPHLSHNMYNIRYMESGDIIRGLPANNYDSNICLILSMNAMCGLTQEFSGHTIALQHGIPRFVPSIDVI